VGNASQLSSSTSGSLDGLSDIDVYSVVASQTGELEVNISSTTSGRLNASVALLDAEGNSLASSGGGVSFSVTAGQTYFVQVSGNSADQAKYDVGVNYDTAANVPAPIPSDGSSGNQEFSSLTGQSTSTTDNSSVTTSLALFTDQAALEAGSQEGLPLGQQVADLLQVGDSSAAIVAVLLVGTGDEAVAQLLQRSDAELLRCWALTAPQTQA
jgi:hypothetical protein